MSDPDLVPRITTVQIYAKDLKVLEPLKHEGETWPQFFERFANMAKEELHAEP